MIKKEMWKIHYKALLRNYLRLLSTASWKMAGRTENSREVISTKDVPLRGPDGQEWWRSKGWHSVTGERLFTPATMTRQTLVSIPGTKWVLWFSLKGPTAPSTCRTEVKLEAPFPKGSSRMVFWYFLKKNRLVSHRQPTHWEEWNGISFILLHFYWYGGGRFYLKS